MAAKSRKGYRRVAGVLPEITRHQGWEAKIDQHSFFPKWESVVREEVASCSKPLKIVKDTLWLEVENSGWMQQLQFEKMSILDDINATLKMSRIKDIKFVLPKSGDEQTGRELPEIYYEPPDSAELKKFEEQVSAVEDEAIRQSLVRLWYLAKACRRRRKE